MESQISTFSILLARKVAPAAVILFCAAIVYLKSFSGSFILDDYPNIIDNKDLYQNEISASDFLNEIIDRTKRGSPRPISRFSLALNGLIFGYDSAHSFKVINFFIHCVNGLLLFIFLEKLRKTLVNHKNHQTTLSSSLLLAIAIAWVVHPINVSAVSYTVQRMTLLSATFSLASLITYLSVFNTSSTKRIILKLFAVIPFTTLLAIMSKENGALVFGYCFVIYSVASTQVKLKNEQKRVHLIFFITFLLVPLISLSALTILQPDIFLSGYKNKDFTLTERLLSESRIILYYAQQIILPQLNDFSLFHDDFSKSTSIIDPVSTLFSILVLIVSVIYAIYVRKRLPFLSIGLLLFLLGHSMESTVLPLELIFEHRNYFPSLGLLIAAFSLLSLIGRKQLLFVISISWITYLTLTGYLHGKIWGSSYLHSESMVKNHPNSLRANMLAATYNLALSSNINDAFFEKGINYLKQGMYIDKSKINAHILLFETLSNNNLEVDPEAIDDVIRRIAHQPLAISTYQILFKLSKSNNKNSLLKQKTIEKMLLAALDNESIMSPHASKIHFGLSEIYKSQGNYLKTITSIQNGLEEKPNAHVYREKLIILLSEGRYYDEAKEQLKYLSNSNYSWLYPDRLEYMNNLIQLERAAND